MTDSPSHPPGASEELPLEIRRSGRLPRPAWIEINTQALECNLAIVRSSIPANVRWLAVVKDDAYGHGAVTVAKAAVSAGASFLGVTTLEEGAALRAADVEAPILILGERHPDELPFCIEHRLRVSVGDLGIARLLDGIAHRAGLCVPVHLKLNTGMNRFGVRCTEAAPAAVAIRQMPGLILEGIMSHFSMSDEADKTFALEQIQRFSEALESVSRAGLEPGLRHLCNTGGFLDLPQAHLDMVRLGILATGVYPSAVCRHLPGLRPVMSVKARIVATRNLAPGDVYGYGLGFRTESPRRIGVLPLGYGDGFPRLKNSGYALVHGRRAPILGRVAMDAMGIDLTEVPEAAVGHEAVLMGTQGNEEITARDLASWGGTVCYDILAGWRHRLPRITVNPPKSSGSIRSLGTENQT
jgi:alanine racemase